MPQCKIDGCREQAVPHRRWGGKRYCEKHGNAYADKRDAALAARAKMPNCESGLSPSCTGKVSERQVSAGRGVCHFCEAEADEIAVRCHQERRKWAAYDSAETVEQLKAWLREYML
jgi:hypothetical protein